MIPRALLVHEGHREPRARIPCAGAGRVAHEPRAQVIRGSGVKGSVAATEHVDAPGSGTSLQSELLHRVAYAGCRRSQTTSRDAPPADPPKSTRHRRAQAAATALSRARKPRQPVMLTNNEARTTRAPRAKRWQSLRSRWLRAPPPVTCGEASLSERSREGAGGDTQHAAWR